MKVPTGCFSPDLLAGKRALVTGAGTGIGKAIAFELARAGADLLLEARRLDVLEAAAAEVSSATGRSVECAVVDIRDIDSVAALAADVAARWARWTSS